MEGPEKGIEDRAHGVSKRYGAEPIDVPDSQDPAATAPTTDKKASNALLFKD